MSEKKVQTGIQLLKIQEVHCEIRKFSFSNPDIIFEQKKIVFSEQFVLIPDLEKDTIEVLLSINLGHPIKGENNFFNFLKYGASFSFHVYEMNKNFFKSENKKLNIPDYLLMTLLSLSFSTIRGMIAIKTLGFEISDNPIPIVDPMFLLKRFKNPEMIDSKR